jgi:excisionase family DNA binding protein
MLENYKDILEVSEVAEVLRLGKNKTYKLIHLGQIPSIKLGAKILVPKKKLLEMLDEVCYNGNNAIADLL